MAQVFNVFTGTFDETGSGGVGGAVDSVFGRTGDVLAQNGDYTAAQVGADASGTAAAAVTAHNGAANAHGQTATGTALLTAVDAAAAKTTLSLNNVANIDLSNVSNDAQLKIASNLSDLNNVATARSNLGVVKITVSATEPVGPAAGDIWIDIS
ncbi:MAG: hypothetical protein IPL34_20425 [Thiofilum sp.]|uniref:hypothetical protein n=1 Tax=Thiofilum sp. TaxID=2212733 RepID=UPI0025F27CC4|nr:hypothetical protein [Thiofilum sp.]MBK8455649.1 hypothetical protein [Thiofilum sp.]